MVNLPPHKFHDKGKNGRLSPLKLYHMANVPPEGIPYGKPSPGRNPIAELPQGNNTIWQAFPPEEIPWQNFPLYGKSPPTQIPYVILGQHVRFFFWGGGALDNLSNRRIFQRYLLMQHLIKCCMKHIDSKSYSIYAMACL